jgi:hypothetical protein
MPKFALILVMIGFYGLGIFGFRFYMSGYRGGHEYFRARVALERLHGMTKDYSEEHGSLPDVEGFNTLLRERWALGRDHAPIEVEDDDIAWHLNFIIEGAIKDNLHLWNSPPHFVLTSASPDGFGFYLDGEDGISKSKGQDQDDINSWDRSSTDFYHEGRRNRRILKEHAIGAALSMGVFVIYFARKKNKRARFQD